jgi:DNA-binding FadR family transcriptional regulator
VLAEVDPSEPPERSQDYPQRVWQKVQWRIQPQLRFRWWEFVTLRQVVPAAVLAAVLIGAFFVGRYSLTPEPLREAAISEQARRQILLVAVADHLERSQLVLIELLNAPLDGPVDASSEQREADDLLTDNRLYRAVAEQSGNAQIADLLDELERVLIELRHGPEQMTPADVARLRATLEQQGTLFKIRVVNAGIQQQQQDHIRSPQTEVF